MLFSSLGYVLQSGNAAGESFTPSDSTTSKAMVPNNNIIPFTPNVESHMIGFYMFLPGCNGHLFHVMCLFLRSPPKVPCWRPSARDDIIQRKTLSLEVLLRLITLMLSTDLMGSSTPQRSTIQ